MLWLKAYFPPFSILRVQRLAATHARQPHPWVMVWTMAVAQVISWGSLYYAFSLFVVPMQESLGWSRPMLNGALSLGLLSTGVVAFPAGAWIDRHGGRSVMTLGSLAGGLLLLAWARVETPWAFYVIWALIGASMAGVLYEPAFAVITATFGTASRRGITALTLVGGFASTVFMPVTQLLIDASGWRHALLVLGGLNLAVCLPLHALFVPGHAASRPPGTPLLPAATASTAHDMKTILRSRVFWGLAIWFTASSATASAIIFQFVPLLTTWGVDMTAILTSVALIGPMQVAGRIVLMLFGTRLETREVGAAVMVLLPAAILPLLLLPHTPGWLSLCAMLYGAGNGLMTIVRGTAVADLIGRTHYGAINGALTIPTTVAKALAPVVTAALWSATGDPSLMLWTLLGSALIGTVGFVLALSGASCRA
ncbi:MAG TPA: MFS transporter [Candidatus Tectomicrobia bacterium]|jgi:MFS family permease